MKDNQMRCTMCGYEFDQSELTCHGACPLGAGCMVVCCPRCGYSTVDPARSGASRWVQRLFRNRPARPGDSFMPSFGSLGGIGGAQVAPPPNSRSLLDLEPGQEAHIADMAGDSARLMQLSQYGLLPGTPVTLTQKRPVPVVQVGQTDLALDASVAALIFVEI